jgi:glycosyltransferase involved in cell wall biosynthesis
MKILFITPVFYPEIGGAETYNRILVNELSKNHHEITVITSGKMARGKRLLDSVVVYYSPYIKVFGTEVISPLHMYRIIRKVRPDLTHGTGPSVTQDIGFFLSRVLRIPMVMTYHATPDLNKAISRIYLSISSKLVLRHLRRIIVTSRRFYSELVEKRHIPKEKLTIIPVGVDYNKFATKGNRNTVREQLSLGEKKIILFVGGLGRRHAYKRADLLIESLVLIRGKIPDVHLLIVGKGEFLPKYKEMVGLLNVQNEVTFCPDVSDEELPNYYSASDVFVLPSPSPLEGFGTVLLEAMSSGIPVITSEECGGAFAVKEGNSGLLYHGGDTKDLSEKIIRILSDDIMALRLSENGRRYSVNYDWSRIAKQVESVYYQTLP